MPILRLQPRRVEKPWGRRDLGGAFGEVDPDSAPVGEIWFEAPADFEAPLLVKYLFTSERLSIQVHPGDEAARRAGHTSGKDEAWLVLAADPGATIGVGLNRSVSKAELRQAALNGDIEGLVDWRPVEPGQAIYSPAGTVHAIGAGLKLVEVQQNVDLTYRLYDYGRPRELHLEEGLAVADPRPFGYTPRSARPHRGRNRICGGPKLVLDRQQGAASERIIGPAWLIPLAGRPCAGDTPLTPGEVFVAPGEVVVKSAEGDELLIATLGPEGGKA